MGIKLEDVNKIIEKPYAKILSSINLEIFEKDFITLAGKSGSGKSSLLYLMSTLDKPSDGIIKIDGKNTEGLSQEEICHFRNIKAGFIFQFHYLISELSVLENILLPVKERKKEKKEYASYLLESMGLIEKIDRLPRQLSGGEAQRAAVARALIMRPRYVFADEPTGSLDSANAKLVIDMLIKANEHLGATIILVTHDSDFANLGKRKITLVDGKISL